MAVIKSFSVIDGDMFYIQHGSDSFTIIDCCLDEENKHAIIDELKEMSKDKGILRFISTHPDEDHVRNLDYLFEQIPMSNFYAVENNATKSDPCSGFKKYCELKQSKNFFPLYKECSRKWLNTGDAERGGAGLSVLWPNTTCTSFKEACSKAYNDEQPNNISPIIRYSIKDGPSFLWMGDLENSFMSKEDVLNAIEFEKTDVLFAPHHGRASGTVPTKWLEQIKPKIIVIGEAPSESLNYYRGYNTITQNTAKDILFSTNGNVVDVYSSNPDYDIAFLQYKQDATYKKCYHKGYFVHYSAS